MSGAACDKLRRCLSEINVALNDFTVGVNAVDSGDVGLSGDQHQEAVNALEQAFTWIHNAGGPIDEALK